MATTFAATKAPRPIGFVSRKAAVPRSFSVATAPIVTRIAMTTPNWPTFLVNWMTASATVGSGIMPPNWPPPTASTISRM